jgi:hypothetical protein
MIYVFARGTSGPENPSGPMTILEARAFIKDAREIGYTRFEIIAGDGLRYSVEELWRMSLA